MHKAKVLIIAIRKAFSHQHAVYNASHFRVEMVAKLQQLPAYSADRSLNEIKALAFRFLRRLGRVRAINDFETMGRAKPHRTHLSGSVRNRRP